MTDEPITICMDVIDRCNLRCPSCYHGIYGGGKGKSSILDMPIAKRALEHITKYFNVSDFHAYNWGEVLLCKNLKEYVDLFAQFPQLKLIMSSNMNAKIDRTLPEQILPNIDVFTFSVSGLQQSVYEKYHRGGNIKKVIKNIDLFLNAREKMNAKTHFQFAFGKNLHNTLEMEKLQNYAIQNGIGFVPLRYYLTDVQEVYKVYKGECIPKERYNLFNSSIHELRNEILDSLTPYTCPVLKTWIVLDCQCNIMTCCCTKISTGVSIFNIKNAEELAEARMNNTFCKMCFESGIYGYFFNQSTNKD